MIGHKGIISDLKRLAKDGSLGQSHLFYGPEAVGKKTVALALARFLEKGEMLPPRFGEVLQDAMVVDLNFMKQIDKKVSDSIGIAAAHEIKNFLMQKPVMSPRRTLIIDDAELLTTEAQNALLKVVEEPPASSLIIIIVSDADAILPTILSRVQKIYFGSVATQEIVEWLVNDHGLPKANAAEVAKRSFGKPGLAWKLAFDEKFIAEIAVAEKFLKIAPAARRDFIKELIAPEDFNLRIFLGYVAFVLSWDSVLQKNPALWHRALALCDTASNFGVNPRLQLESLLG